MKQYVNKAALVAEIEKRIADNKKEIERASHKNLEDYFEGYEDALTLFKEQFLNTLEVKDEVDSSHPIKAMKDALRTEYEKGRADVLRLIDPDEMVADFCSQPFSKTRSIASVYRQGIIDIIKRINNNEKTSIIGTRSIDNCGL
jgi:hypothetical protein